MKSWELLKLLEEGKTLQKIYHNDLECVKTVYRATYQHKDNDEVGWYDVYQYEFYGWDSGPWLPRDHFLDLLQHPEGWEEIVKV